MVRLYELPFTMEALFENLSYYQMFCETFDVSAMKLARIVRKLCIPDWQLFEFTSMQMDSMLVASDAVQREEVITCISTGQIEQRIKTFDLYVTTNDCVDDVMDDVARLILRTKFPFTNSSPFVREVRRFSPDVKMITKGTKLKDVPRILYQNEITAEDICRLLTDEGYADSILKESLFIAYADGEVVLQLEDERIKLKMSDFLNRDWYAVEHRPVYDAIAQRYVPQNSVPWFSHPLVASLEDVFIRLHDTVMD